MGQIGCSGEYLLGWTLPFISSHHQHLESLHHALLQRMVGCLWLSTPTHTCISHLTFTQGIVEQMVLRKLAYNTEKSKTRVSQIWTLGRLRTEM